MLVLYPMQVVANFKRVLRQNGGRSLSLRRAEPDTVDAPQVLQFDARNLEVGLTRGLHLVGMEPCEVRARLIQNCGREDVVPGDSGGRVQRALRQVAHGAAAARAIGGKYVQLREIQADSK
jgi:hypothetical protein